MTVHPSRELFSVTNCSVEELLGFPEATLALWDGVVRRLEGDHREHGHRVGMIVLDFGDRTLVQASHLN